MAKIEGTITTNEMNVVYDQEFIANFNEDWERFSEMLGLFDADTARAGEALYQVVVEGQLEEGVTEGEPSVRSQYTVDKEPVGSMEILRWEKASTMEAIQKSGAVNAIYRTDKQALKELRAMVLDELFTFLGNGTTTATAETLQGALAQVDAEILNEMEDKGDTTDRIIHFVNRSDIADYLEKHPVTLETMFGIQYLANFLGITDVIITNKVPKGKVYATPAENIHVFGADFASFAAAGLPYEVQDRGLIAVHHEPSYKTGAVVTYIAKACTLLAEKKNFIGVATISGGNSADEGTDDEQGDPVNP